MEQETGEGGTLEEGPDGGVEAEVGEGARGEVPLLVVFLGLRLCIHRRRRRRRPAELPLDRVLRRSSYLVLIR